MKLLPLDPPIEEHNEILLISPREKEALRHALNVACYEEMPSNQVANDIRDFDLILNRN